MIKKSLGILAIVLLFSHCQQNEGHHHQSHKVAAAHGHLHGEANKHMHQKSVKELAESFENPDRMATQKPYEVIALFGELRGKTIMDIGAGSGYFAFKLAEKGANVIAADVDDEFLSLMKNKMIAADISETQMQFRKLPYDSPMLKKQEVDGVIVVNTYHHIEQRPAYFHKVKEGLKENGTLMIVDFMKKKFETDVEGPPINMRIAANQVIQELEAAGFEKIELDTILLPFQFIIQAKK